MEGQVTKRIAVITPVGRDFNRDWFKNSQESLALQASEDVYPVSICVTQGGLDIPDQPEGLERHVAVHGWKEGDGITVMDQISTGYRLCERLDIDFICLLSVDDFFLTNALSYLVSCFDDEDVMVSYGDFVMLENDGRHEKISVPERFDVDRILDSGVIQNFIPDMAMVRKSLLGEVLFDPSLRNASYHIWWLRVWEKFGDLAFEHCGKVFYAYRRHDSQLSNGVDTERQQWRKEGVFIRLDWINNWGPFKGKSLGEFHCKSV